jgi:hypothetical protein
MHRLSFTFSLLYFFLLSTLSGNESIDSLVYLSERCASDSEKVDLYVQIANKYLFIDPNQAYDYTKKNN